MKKNLKELLKTIVFIPAGVLAFALILAIAGAIAWVILQIINSIHPSQGNMLDGARQWGIILLSIGAFIEVCFGLGVGSITFFNLSSKLSPEYINKKILAVVVSIVYLTLAYFILSTMYMSFPEESSIFIWIAFIIAILLMAGAGIVGVVGTLDEQNK